MRPPLPTIVVAAASLAALLFLIFWLRIIRPGVFVPTPFLGGWFLPAFGTLILGLHVLFAELAKPTMPRLSLFFWGSGLAFVLLLAIFAMAI